MVQYQAPTGLLLPNSINEPVPRIDLVAVCVGWHYVTDIRASTGDTPLASRDTIVIDEDYARAENACSTVAISDIPIQ